MRTAETVSKTHQSNPGELIVPPQVNPLDLLSQWRREAVQESGWKQSALAQHLGVSEHYLSRMLNGEKSFPDRHVVRLPRDIQIRVATKFLEHVGYIVVAPVTPQEWRRCLAVGLFGSLGAVWASPLKASLPQRRATDVA